MITLATLFDEKVDDCTKNIWETLCLTCSLSDIHSAPFPHITWLSAERQKIGDIKAKIELFVNHLPDITVRTSGIGIFTDPAPIIYLPIIKTKSLIDIHTRIWQEISPLMDGINSHYDPDQWVPHITIAIGDVTPSKVACAVSQLASLNLGLEISVDNLALLSNVNNNPKVVYKIHFSKARSENNNVLPKV